MGQEREADADVLFASIQTLGRVAHLERFPRDAFDYIVVDEFHHAAAPTYSRLIAHFRPKFLLGLTATPERTDGGDLLALCEENLVYRCDLVEGVKQDLLCRFRYFDEPRRHPVARPQRLRAAPEARRPAPPRPGLLRLPAPRGLHGLPPRGAVAGRALGGPAGRHLRGGRLQRGPRPPRAGHHPHAAAHGIADPLTVIDYIGNHRTFLLKPQTLFSLPAGGQEVLNLLERARQGPIEIAPGCFVTYELDTIDILRALVRVTADRQEALKRYYEEFVELHGARPRALEAFHEGYNPRAARAAHGSWLGFVGSRGGLDAGQSEAFERHRAFLDELEDTPMTKSYKMLVLLGMLNEDAFPGEITIDTLAESVAALASRNHRLVADLGPKAATPDGLKRHLEQNPIEAWTGGRGTGGTPYFAYENGVFRTTFATKADDRPALQELARELADWRLAEYDDRLERQPQGETS